MQRVQQQGQQREHVAFPMDFREPANKKLKTRGPHLSRRRRRSFACLAVSFPLTLIGIARYQARDLISASLLVLSLTSLQLWLCRWHHPILDVKTVNHPGLLTARPAMNTQIGNASLAAPMFDLLSQRRAGIDRSHARLPWLAMSSCFAQWNLALHLGASFLSFYCFFSFLKFNRSCYVWSWF